MNALSVFAARKYKQHQAEKRQVDTLSISEFDEKVIQAPQEAELAMPARPDCTGRCAQPRDACTAACDADCYHQRKCARKCQRVGCCERKRRARQANAIVEAELLGLSLPAYEDMGCCERKKRMRAVQGKGGCCGGKKRRAVLREPVRVVGNEGGDGQSKEVGVEEMEVNDGRAEVESGGQEVGITAYIEPPAYDYKM